MLTIAKIMFIIVITVIVKMNRSVSVSKNENTYKGIYAMHKYWGKKPFNEISKFIEEYSECGDTVMDCFCGSGVTLIEGLKLQRKCIGVDLNPIAIKLTKASITAVDIDELNKIFNSIKTKLKEQINDLYKMSFDGEETLVTHTIWKNTEPIEVWYSTPTKKKNIRQGLDIDKKMANNPERKPSWYPTSVMFENSRLNVKKEQQVDDLFTPRALVALSLILDEIKKIKDENIRNVFELTFSGTLSQASNLVFVIRRRKKNENSEPRAEVGSWVIGYWVPEEHFEINAWNCFENRFKRILKGEIEINELFKYRENNIDDVKLFNGTATNIPIEDNTVDYVFIDPPHADRVLYIEQSLMWNAWLGLDEKIEWDKEIIVSSAKGRKDKDIKGYNELLSKSFNEIRRVLKPHKYFSFAFNCLDDKTWLNTLNLFIKYGFELKDIVPLEYSATSVIQDNRKNALKTDFVMTFKNESNNFINDIVFNDDEILLEEKILEIVRSNSDVEVYNIMNKLFEETIPKGYIFRVSSIVKKSAEIL